MPERKGFALAAALLAALLVAALVAGVFLAATEEARTTSALARREVSLTDAESAIARALGNLGVGSGGALRPGETLAMPGGDAQTPVVYVTRLDSTLFWLVADASEGALGTGASRRIGVVVRRILAANDSITVDLIPGHAWSELF